MLALLFLYAAPLASALDAVQVANQSEHIYQEAQPIATKQGKGQLDTPEVVLSVKYDRGAIDGIYLAQYRKNGAKVGDEAVLEGRELCSDLCHAGLGGEGCGTACRQLIPVGLLDITNRSAESAELIQDSEVVGSYGIPRMGVCPTLCSNDLGYPLCGCAVPTSGLTPNWSEVCAAFCNTDGYCLRGCPPCQSPARTHAAARILDTVEGWTAWCHVQCRQGQGGAACNCDLSPFGAVAAA